MKDGISAASGYFSKGKKKTGKDSIPDENAETENRKTPEEKEKELGEMKNRPPNHPDYKPPKNWNGKKVRVGDKMGWPAKNGDVWVPDYHGGTHSPHWDVQHPNGTYDPVYPVSSNTPCSTK